MATLTETTELKREAGDVLPAVLCVDDDVNILDGFRRHLRKKFRIHTAEGPFEGLRAVENQGPFSVIVSDFQMPGMNGVEFLSRVRALAPDSVRIMLTGQADFSTAMGAVNQGNIFRFLVKPCAPLILEKVLENGFAQHCLLVAERQLTEQTLLGCVQVLVEVLSIVQPEAFSQSNRVRRYVRHIADGLGFRIDWQVEAAAMLSQIGWITLAPALLAKAAAGEALDEDESICFQKHAGAAARILEKIPRLDRVAKMIAFQHTPLHSLPVRPTLDGTDSFALGAMLLKAATDFDRLRCAGLRHEDVVNEMRRAEGQYLPEVIEAMATIERTEAQDEIRLVPLNGLQPGMILEEELRSKNGILLLGRGQEVPASFLQRLGNYSYGLAFDHVCRVRVRQTNGASG